MRNPDQDYIWNSQFLLAAQHREQRESIMNAKQKAAGLAKIAAAAQTELRTKGLHEAECSAHFQLTKWGSDHKAIAVKIGDHRNAAYVKDCFDMGVVNYLADSFFDAYQTAREEIQ